MKFANKDGVEHDFELDLKALLEMEQDPDFSLMDLTDRMDKKFRFTDLVLLASAIGWDLQEFRKAGYTAPQLVDIFVGCLAEWGFTSEQDAPST